MQSASSFRPAPLRSVLFVLAALLLATPAWAAGAEDYLKAKQQELTSVVQQPKSAESDAELQRKFDALLDYATLARDSLGEEWGKLDAAQQSEFQSLLRTLVQRAYTKNIRETLDYDVSFGGEMDAKAGKLVKSVATHKTDKRKEPIQIDYLVHQVDGQWRVMDIITEGSSLVANYRGQFKKIIAEKGVSGLLERMRQKAAS
jgi:phospholipid transport system substrate-binding protein